MTNYVSSQSSYCCDGNTNNNAKALASTTGWNSSTTTCSVGDTPSNNNATGFGAMPAGYGTNSPYYYDLGTSTQFLTATQYSNNDVYVYYISCNYANVGRYNGGNSGNKSKGSSIRCVRD